MPGDEDTQFLILRRNMGIPKMILHGFSIKLWHSNSWFNCFTKHTKL